MPLQMCFQDPLPSRIHSAYQSSFFCSFFYSQFFLSPTLAQGQTVFKASPMSVTRGDPERRSRPGRPPSRRASTTGSILSPAHQCSGLVSHPSRRVPRRVFLKPGSFSLPFLAGAKETLAGAQVGPGTAGMALSAGWSVRSGHSDGCHRKGLEHQASTPSLSRRLGSPGSRCWLTRGLVGALFPL